MHSGMLMIDGSMGEGGGQVLRSSLALSLVTGRPFTITKIRGGRAKPGLQRQHLTAVNAAAEISTAEVRGARPGSSELVFIPGTVKPGVYRFSVGTAGSTTLVLQTVLPALMTASGSSELTLEGGTHNPLAPSYDFLEQAFLPCIRTMGPKVSSVLHRPGYYPAGGGRFSATIEPVRALAPLAILERGELRRRRALAVVCRLSPDIGKRELRTVQTLLNWDPGSLELVEDHTADGPGNVLTLELRFDNITEVFTGFGEKGVPAEEVAGKAAREARDYLASGAPVGNHLADQLLLPLALAGRGTFRTMAPSRHTLTNIEVIEKFLELNIRCEDAGKGIWQVSSG